MVNNSKQNTKTHNNFGKNYFGIDFDLKEGVQVVNNTHTKGNNISPVIGSLIIDNKRIDITYQELDKLIETLTDTKLVLRRKHQLGLK